MNKENMSKLRAVADRYGFEKQIIILFEELSELQKAVCKYSRVMSGSIDDPNILKNNITEEIADVEIMLNQIMYLIGIYQDRVDEIIGQKLNRQMERIKNG